MLRVADPGDHGVRVEVTWQLRHPAVSQDPSHDPVRRAPRQVGTGAPTAGEREREREKERREREKEKEREREREKERERKRERDFFNF